MASMTREQAIAALVERDVAKWGDSERAASERRWSDSSHGAALNSLGSALLLDGEKETGERLMLEAKLLLTAADHRRFAQGG
jgi:hypothetical protein